MPADNYVKVAAATTARRWFRLPSGAHPSRPHVRGPLVVYQWTLPFDSTDARDVERAKTWAEGVLRALYAQEPQLWKRARVSVWRVTALVPRAWSSNPIGVL